VEFDKEKDNKHLYIYMLNIICKAITKNMTMLMFEVMFGNFNA